jgi:hypothetical protein
MNSGLSPNSRQKCELIVLRFPEKSQARGRAENSDKATILLFPHRTRASGMLPVMSQRHGSDPGHIAKWLIFKLRKVADNNWQVRARLGSRDESHYVATFSSEVQALEWIASDRADEWMQQCVTRRRQAGGG